MRAVFMGTPAFAVPSLRALLSAGHDVAGVFCQPDRPQGRGNRLVACPVKVFALGQGLPVYQFDRLRAPEGVAALANLAPDCVVTAAFGQILSQALLDIPRRGAVNVHASLLPRYRGPAPINWCIINGERITGVTTMLTDAGVDTGDILLQQQVEILPHETAGALSERLAHAGAALLVRTLAAVEAGNCPRAAQDAALASRHPMLRKDLGRVDWALPACRIANLVRGTDPWPGAYTALAGETLKILRAEALPGDSGKNPGVVLCGDGRQGLQVSTGEGVLRVLHMQAPGGKPMPAADYLRGHPIAPGTRLGSADTPDEGVRL
ncbi:MAG: methionyl-tRNA formyltransferase [Oscillospiraceae bacterium]|jgi:methionyl-tRNA formyltransferase|nr:methionyl-tRNA formyltransferase [Oscillospiraceae bacterium]